MQGLCLALTLFGTSHVLGFIAEGKDDVVNPEPSTLSLSSGVALRLRMTSHYLLVPFPCVVLLSMFFQCLVLLYKQCQTFLLFVVGLCRGYRGELGALY